MCWPFWHEINTYDCGIWVMADIQAVQLGSELAAAETDIDGIHHTLHAKLLLLPPQEKMPCLPSISHHQWLSMKQQAESAIALHPIPSSWQLPPFASVVHIFNVSHMPWNARVITIHNESSN